MAIPIVTVQLHLFLAGMVASVLALLTIFVSLYWSLKPGNWLHLRPRTTPTPDRAEMAVLVVRPRMTIRQGMIVVAVAAILLTATAEDLKRQRQT
jgi:hypothetical protein